MAKFKIETISTEGKYWLNRMLYYELSEYIGYNELQKYSVENNISINKINNFIEDLKIKDYTYTIDLVKQPEYIPIFKNKANYNVRIRPETIKKFITKELKYENDQYNIIKIFDEESFKKYVLQYILDLKGSSWWNQIIYWFSDHTI